MARSSASVANITESSISRTVSVFKLYTGYLFLAEAGESYFSRAITEFIPEFAQAVNATTAGGSINNTRWEDITIVALAKNC